jgi:hypothetical protein
MQAHDIWKSRLANIKKRVLADTKDKTGSSKKYRGKGALAINVAQTLQYRTAGERGRII